LLEVTPEGVKARVLTPVTLDQVEKPAAEPEPTSELMPVKAG